MAAAERWVSTKALHAYVAATGAEGNRAGMGVVFVDVHGQVLRRIGRTLHEVTSRDLAAYRGILYALWNSRRLGARWIVVHGDTADVIAQINGDQEIPPTLVGPYLEVRALLHAYRGARVKTDDTLWGREAAALAQTALAGNTDDIVEDLPLWADRPALTRSTA
jgi:reverse transcriptase-like protein